MKSYFVCIAAAVLWISPAYGQNIIEHAAAAAGATIGTGAGKALSNGIDKILGRAADTGSNAGKPTTVRPSPTTPAVTPTPTLSAPTTVLQGPGSPAGPTGTSQPGPTQHARARRSAVPVDPDKPVFAAPEVASAPVRPLAIAPPPPSPEDFAKLKEGSPREDVQTALGTASSRITIPGDDGHLIEILSYYDGNRHIGTVRMDNGVVVSVSAVQ
jgi:hypothetical protein